MYVYLLSNLLLIISYNGNKCFQVLDCTGNVVHCHYADHLHPWIQSFGKRIRIKITAGAVENRELPSVLLKNSSVLKNGCMLYACCNNLSGRGDVQKALKDNVV